MNKKELMDKFSLTSKQAQFVLHYSGNGTQAALKAGYSVKSAAQEASRLMSQDKIKDALNYVDTAMPVGETLTRQEVLAQLSHIVSQGTNADKLRALKELALLLGYKQEDASEDQLDRLSDAELIARAEQAVKGMIQGGLPVDRWVRTALADKVEPGLQPMEADPIG